MLTKTIHFLIIILILSIPLINSHLLDIFYLENIGKYFYINGNYEFSKIIFFNIFSGIIIFLFFIKNMFSENKIIFSKIIIYLLGIVILSNIFSISPFTSLLGNSDKGHSSLMFVNLIGLYIVFINLLQESNKFKNKILKTIIFSGFIVSIVGIKEFLLPTFDYGDLSNRAVSTFGHPNYLALYLILIIRIVNNFLTNSKQFLQKLLYGTILFFITIGLFLTKSVWAIFLFFNYLIYLKYEKINKIIHLGISSFNTKGKGLQNIIFIFIYLSLLIVGIFFILKLYPEKLSSFISRFYIWDTTLNIIFSDIKTFIFGNGLGNLDLIFEGFKTKELYIFENFGFVADRPHNIFLNIFYSFGIVGVSLFGYLIYSFYKKISTIPPTSFIKGGLEIIVLFLLFNIFNFSSIASYLIIIFIISIFYNVLTPFNKGDYRGFYSILISIFFIFTSLFSIYFYINYFTEEHKIYNNSEYETNNFLLKQINLEDKEKTIFNTYYKNSKILCNKLILNSASAENHIYCGNLVYNSDKNSAIKYYNLGLNKLPDLWNENSKYYNSIFVNKKNLQHRFFSEKYGNLSEVLERVGIKK